VGLSSREFAAGRVGRSERERERERERGEERRGEERLRRVGDRDGWERQSGWRGLKTRAYSLTGGSHM
jgi:hypothetical protein